MASASGQRTAVRYVAESAFGVPAGTAYNELRFTDVGLNLSKALLESKEIRADRQLADVRHGMRSVGGDVSFELGLATFDDLLAAALGGTWQAVTTGAVSLEADADTDAYVRTTGSFLADGFLPGDEVTATSFAQAGNNGRAKVVAVSALQLTVDRPLTADAAAAGRTVALVGRRVANGTLLSTFSFERAFTDIGQYLLYSGCAVDGFKLSVKPGEIVSGSFALLGKDMAVAGASHAASVTPPAAHSPFDAFAGVLLEGDEVLADVTSLELDVGNGRSAQPVIGTRSAREIHEGAFRVSGTLAVHFRDSVLLEKFLDEEESSLDVRLGHLNGTDFHRLRIPRLKYTGATLNNPASGPVIKTLPFTALRDSVSGATILYQRSNV